MNNLNNSSNKPLVNKWLVVAGIFISLVGFADASYLSLKHFQGKLPDCSIVRGCEVVLTSQYSTLLGIPVALFGALYYLAIFVGLVVYLDSKNLTILKITSLTTAVGLIASLYFFHLQLVIIKVWCQFCILSTITSTLLFFVGVAIYQKLLPQDVIEANQ